MMICRICGGQLVFHEASESIVCESCGKSQTIQCMVGGMAEPLYAQSPETDGAINTYKRAMNMYLQEASVRTLDTAAQMFKNIPQVLNASDMVRKCQEKSRLLAMENSYNKALDDMQSEDPQKLRSAVETLHLLADYKDAPKREQEARSLLAAALQKEQQAEKARQQAKLRKLLLAAAAVVAVILIVVLSVVGNAARYDSENLVLSLSPGEDYLTVEKYQYVFHYALEMENAGSLDIKGFEADVVMEDEDGKVVVDTQMQASDMTALVRKGKSRELTWNLSVKDEDVALTLYEDFSDLEVNITITQITFANGKVKDYS